MKTDAQKADVLIVGGGLMGCATAIELRRHGRSVIVFEKDVPGRHASGHNSGGVRCQGRDLREVAFAMESRKMWDHHPETVGSDCGFHVSPRLRLAETPEEMTKLEQRHHQLTSLGYEHEVLCDRGEVMRLCPNLADHVVGGLVCLTDGLANPLVTSKAYAATAEAAGATLLAHTQVVEASTSSAGFTIRTACGKSYQGEALVNAAGAWAGRFAALLEDPLPVFPAAPTIMVTNRVPGLMNGTSVGTVGRPLGLMAASNGTVIVAGGYRSPFDLETGQIWIDPLQLSKAARIMTELIPKLGRAQMIRSWAAFEGSLSDKVPIVGESKRVPGLFHICGFTGHGFQLAPMMGRLMAQVIRGQQPELSLAELQADRFE